MLLNALLQFCHKCDIFSTALQENATTTQYAANLSQLAAKSRSVALLQDQSDSNRSLIWVWHLCPLGVRSTPTTTPCVET